MCVTFPIFPELTLWGKDTFQNCDPFIRDHGQKISGGLLMETIRRIWEDGDYVVGTNIVIPSGKYKRKARLILSSTSVKSMPGVAIIGGEAIPHCIREEAIPALKIIIYRAFLL